MSSYPCTRTTGTDQWRTVTSSGTAAWRWRSGCTVPCATPPNCIACRRPWPWRSCCTAGWSGGSGSNARPAGRPRSRPTGHDVTPSSSSWAAGTGPVRHRSTPGRPGDGHRRISVHDGRAGKPRKPTTKPQPVYLLSRAFFFVFRRLSCTF